MIRKDKSASPSEIVASLKGRTITDVDCTVTEGQSGAARVDLKLDNGETVSIRTGLYGSGVGYYVPVPPAAGF